MKKFRIVRNARRPIGKPLEFASCDFYQVFAVIPRRVNTDGAGNGPRFPHSKAADVGFF